MDGEATLAKMVHNAYPCPCCGYLTFDQLPGSFSLCPICFWEDDAGQLRDVGYAGGANKVSLLEAQRTFAQFGASEQCFISDVRAPYPHEERDPEWRLVNTAIDQIEDDPRSPRPTLIWPDDLTHLY